MLRKPFSIRPMSSQLQSSSWLISVLIHVALIVVISEVFIIKTNHKNDGLRAFEFVIYQPEPTKSPQKEIPKDIAKAVLKVNSKIVSKPEIVSKAKIVSQSQFFSKQKDLSLEISENKPQTIPKPKPTIIPKETVPTRNPSQGIAPTTANFHDLASKKPGYKDKTDLDKKLSSQPKKPAQHNLRLVNASESKSPTKQMGVSLNEALASAPATKQIQTKLFESKKSYNIGKITNEKKSIVDLLEPAQNTKTESMNSNLYNINQTVKTQNKYFTSTTELAVREKLLKNWAATIRNDIVERTLELKLRSDVRISLKISRTGEILNIKTIGASVNNDSFKNFINVIKTSGKFPTAPRGLKLDYVTFPVNFRSRG